MAYDEEYAEIYPNDTEKDLSIKDMIVIGVATICLIGTITIIGDSYNIKPCDFYYDTFP